MISPEWQIMGQFPVANSTPKQDNASAFHITHLSRSFQPVLISVGRCRL